MKPFVYWTAWILSLHPRRRESADLRVLVFNPVPHFPGSLGDQAVLVSITRLLTSHGCTVRAVTEESELIGEPVDQVLAPRTMWGFRFLGLARRMVNEFAQADWVVVPGVDILDGGYGDDAVRDRFRLARLALRCGSRVHLTAFSINETPSRISAQGLCKLRSKASMSVRDPISLQRLPTKAGINTALLCADPAFLLEPDETGVEGGVAWIEEQKDAGRTVLGLNLGPKVCQGTGERDVVRCWLRVLTRVNDLWGPVAVVLVPHDYRRKIDDRPLLTSLGDKLAPTLPCFAALTRGVLSPRHAKAIVGHAHFVITAKMHLAIASLSSCVPAISLAYQGKFQGLYQHLGLDPLTIPIERATDEEFLVEALYKALSEKEEIEATLWQMVPEVQARARNCLHPII